MTDTISDMLTRIRNASQALQPEVEVAYSKLKENLARVLKQEGYIADYGVEGAPIKRIRLKLKRSEERRVGKESRYRWTANQ